MSKAFLVCPKCGEITTIKPITGIYECKCGWSSISTKTIDISYKSEVSCTLSNLYPHKFTMPIKDNLTVTCLSMETFLQSLKIPDSDVQKYFLENYSGYMAYKAKLTMPDWRKDQTLYWMGQKIDRHSDDYQKLLTKAYDRLFETNPYFRNVVLPRFKDYYLIHTTGVDNPLQTILTEEEYRYQLNRLMEKI